MWRVLFSSAALAVMATGCHHSVEINPAPSVPVSARWTATLASPKDLHGAVEIHGSAWMAPPAVGDSGRALISIQIANAAPGGVHPWAVHRGSCGGDLGIYGSDRAYPPLKVGSDGTATAKTEQTLPPPKAGDYFVEVLAAPSNTTMVIACGNMAAPQG